MSIRHYEASVVEPLVEARPVALGSGQVWKDLQGLGCVDSQPGLLRHEPPLRSPTSVDLTQAYGQVSFGGHAASFGSGTFYVPWSFAMLAFFFLVENLILLLVDSFCARHLCGWECFVFCFKLCAFMRQRHLSSRCSWRMAEESPERGLH